MKISVAKRDVSAALQVVSNSMSGTDVEMSSQFVFRPVEGVTDRAEVLTFSGRLYSSCAFDAVIEGADANPDKAFTIEGARLKQWLRSVPDSALEFDYDADTKVVTAVAPKGSQEFRSLDPKGFPYWDDTLAKVELTASIPAGRFSEALSFTRKFVADSKMETTSPQHCVTEVRAGAFLSNDKRAGCMVKVVGLEKCGIRVFTGDMGATLKFLSTLPSDENVDILEHARGFLLRRPDGAIFGQTKFQAAFPIMNLPLEWEDEFWWELPKDELKSALPFLLSGADKDDVRVFFARPVEDGPIQVGMIATTGNLKTLQLDPVGYGQKLLPAAEGEEAEEATEPTPEFMLSVECLQKVIAGTMGSTVRFGINRRKGSGFARFREDRDTDQFLTVMAWLRK